VHVKNISHQYSIIKEDNGNSKEMTQNVQDEFWLWTKHISKNLRHKE
jgi:hypothetical protein